MRGRGIDFEHRFKTSRWAEDLLIHSLGAELGLITVRFGISVVHTDGDLIYGTTPFKEPDLLVFRVKDLTNEELEFFKDGDISSEDRKQFEEEGRLEAVIKKAIVAIEVEFSPYRAKEMVGRLWKCRTMEAWQKRPLKNAVPPTAPNIWVKEEDLGKLVAWERHFSIPIVVAHLFDQESYAIPLSRVSAFDEEYRKSPEEVVRLQVTSGVFKKLQSYDRVDAQGAGEKKFCFVITPAASIKLGDIEGVHVSAQLGLGSSKKYVSHVLFTEGKLTVSDEFLNLIDGLKG